MSKTSYCEKRHAALAAMATITVMAIIPAGRAATPDIYGLLTPSLSAVQNNGCGAGVANAADAGQAALKLAGAHVQNDVSPPGNLNSESCIKSIMSNAGQQYQKLESAFGGSGGLGGFLSSLGSSVVSSAEQQACSTLYSQWDSASNNINAITSLPSSFGQEVTGAASGMVSQAGGAASNAASTKLAPVQSVTSKIQSAPANATSSVTNNLF